MKNTSITILISVIIFSCGPNQKTDEKSPEEQLNKDTGTPGPDNYVAFRDSLSFYYNGSTDIVNNLMDVSSSHAKEMLQKSETTYTHDEIVAKFEDAKKLVSRNFVNVNAIEEIDPETGLKNATLVYHNNINNVLKDQFAKFIELLKDKNLHTRLEDLKDHVNSIISLLTDSEKQIKVTINNYETKHGFIN